jgi:hypothetical protein
MLEYLPKLGRSKPGSYLITQMLLDILLNTGESLPNEYYFVNQ